MSLKSFTLFVNLIIFVTGNIVIQNRIIGGEDTVISNYPYIVSIVTLGDHLCGGSIVNSYTVISAAHCFYNDIQHNVNYAKYYHILSGITYRNDRSGQTYQIKEIIINPLYNPKTLEADIAIVKTKDKIKFCETTQPISLPISVYSRLPIGQTAEVTGWGMLKFDGPLANLLQTVNVTIWDYDDCKDVYKEYMSRNVFCAGDILGRYDACIGDSGGPLTYNKTTLFGIVSWGKECGRPNYPGIYTNVKQFRPWIDVYL